MRTGTIQKKKLRNTSHAHSEYPAKDCTRTIQKREEREREEREREEEGGEGRRDAR